MTTNYDFDFIVIGGGSGGIAAAKRAATYGKKVGVVEYARPGGTCVNVGCVPKKIMFMAASIMDTIKHDASQYAFSGSEKVTFDWKTLKEKRDQYIVKLNTIYEHGLHKNDIEWFQGIATFMNDSHTISITMMNDDGTSTVKNITSNHIVIATGGRPMIPPGDGIEEHCITSDGFFELEELPPVVVVVGAGYIAVELAGILNALGSETHLVIRKDIVLRTFDIEIALHLCTEMRKQGIHMYPNTNGVAKVEIEKTSGKKMVTLNNGDVIFGVDTVLMAVGRVPNTEKLNLDQLGITTTNRDGGGFIQVDDYQNTSVPNIYALGDVCDRKVELTTFTDIMNALDDVCDRKIHLTPMAIAAGRRLADRLFGGIKNAKVSYENVPTVVFSHPPIGTCGMTQTQAIYQYGQDNIKVYKSEFVNLLHSIFDMDRIEKPQTLMKIVTAGTEEKVVGMHVIGMGADEIIQGFGVAMKMGATKADLDSCIAIHPTASEEFVTMGVWGSSPQETGAKVSPLMGASPGEPTLMSKI